MSELQISLLIIGVTVVLVVYGYGAWQQRQYRNYYGPAFDPRQTRQDRSSAQFDQGQFDQDQFEQEQFDQDRFEQNRFDQDRFDQDRFDQNQFAQNQPNPNQVNQNQFNQNQFDQDRFDPNRFNQGRPAQNQAVQNRPAQNRPVQNRPVQNRPVQNSPRATPRARTGGVSAARSANDVLEADSDYIIELKLPSPMHGDVLAQMWRQRFDFGKAVTIRGSTTRGSWERSIAEKQPTPFSVFRLALQLVDRNGPVTEAQLAGFRALAYNIARNIGATVEAPDVPAMARHALALDAFCGEVDQMVGLNILPAGSNLLLGREVASSAAKHGMELQPDGIFYLRDAQGRTLFSLFNFDNTPFNYQDLAQMEIAGLAMQLDVPRVEHPTRQFDVLMQLAHAIGRELQAEVVDDYRAPLSNTAINTIRTQIAAIEQRMVARRIVPGSAKALRLFS
jgi:FtsZ-interacting cell division protein ZipA